MYHDLPRGARGWSFLLLVDQDLAETARKKAGEREVETGAQLELAAVSN
jgi:hypothetical protein